MISTPDNLASPPWFNIDADDSRQSFRLVAVKHTAAENSLQPIADLIQQAGILLESKIFAADRVTEYLFDASCHQAWQIFQACMALSMDCDIAVIPTSVEPIKLLICDMDSTIVNGESLDEIATRAGVGEQVQTITTAAMRGEIDFHQALQQRLALLRGIPVAILHEVAAGLQCNQGAVELVRVAKAYGVRTVLVSGGFDPLVATIADRLGFDHAVCNQFKTDAQQLTGELLPPLIDAQMKHTVLQQQCQQLGIKPDAVCAIGDGANDIPMLQAAGLGIAYCAKPLVRAATAYHIQSADLRSALAFIGLPWH